MNITITKQDKGDLALYFRIVVRKKNRSEVCNSTLKSLHIVLNMQVGLELTVTTPHHSTSISSHHIVAIHFV